MNVPPKLKEPKIGWRRQRLKKLKKSRIFGAEERERNARDQFFWRSGRRQIHGGPRALPPAQASLDRVRVCLRIRQGPGVERHRPFALAAKLGVRQPRVPPELPGGQS